MSSLDPGQTARRGLVQVLTGDGKGKTTSALGSVIRALGHGWKVCIIFFMKSGYPSGELNILSKLPHVTFANFGSGELIDPNNIRPEDRKQAQLALEAGQDAVLSGKFDLVVLDEVNLAVHWKLVKLEAVAKLIHDKPPHVELILTGRNADSRITGLADLVTECRSIKHPYDRGVKAREGIEY
ncbi:MAG: cob(I)yrinic acid a,c-diamide adenosyltransferase [Chloroflexota bacterium]